MSNAAKTTSLDCRSCAAPLPVLGGHQVRSITCGYCGAVMDAHDEFKVLAKYQQVSRPETPFEIGKVGIIKGVGFTVIGVVRYGYQDKWGRYEWVSSQLFSPTHGYAWITLNEGHVVFTRSVRELPSPALPTGTTPKKSSISLRGEKFRFYEGFEASITFVEGELTWLASLGDKVQVAEYIAPPKAFEYEQSEGELSYALSEYLDPKEVMEAFKLTSLPKRKKIHPAQPFKTSAFGQAIANTSYWFLILSAVALVFIMIIGGGQKVAETQLRLTPGLITQLPFAFDRPNQLLYVRIATNLNNSWTYVEATIVDDTGETVSALGREIGYYSGYSGGESWTEGSRDSTATIKLPRAGSYALEIEVDPQSPGATNASIEIWQGYFPWRYFVGLTVLFLIAALSITIRRLIFEKRRWAEVIDDD